MCKFRANIQKKLGYRLCFVLPYGIKKPPVSRRLSVAHCQSATFGILILLLVKGVLRVCKLLSISIYFMLHKFIYKFIWLF